MMINYNKKRLKKSLFYKNNKIMFTFYIFMIYNEISKGVFLWLRYGIWKPL